MLKKYGIELFFVLDLNEDDILDAYIFSGEEADKWIHILSLVVVKDYEGQGIGKLLVQYLKEKTVDQQFKGLRLEVNEKNVRAIKLYRNFGFKQVDLLKNYYRKGEHALVMKYEY